MTCTNIWRMFLIGTLAVLAGIVPFAYLQISEAINAEIAILTMYGVFVALFQEQIKAFIFPWELALEIVKPPICEKQIKVWVFHMRVINKTAGRPLKDCQVLLSGIKRGAKAERIPVARTFRWAPAENRDLTATIWTDKILDFARLPANDSPENPHKFFLTFYQYFDKAANRYVDQGGSLMSWVETGENVDFTIQIRTEDFEKNYSVLVSWDGNWNENESELEKHLQFSISDLN